MIAGCLLVFVPALGSFITSDLLGGAKQVMIGNLVQNQFTSARNSKGARARSPDRQFSKTAAHDH